MPTNRCCLIGHPQARICREELSTLILFDLLFLGIIIIISKTKWTQEKQIQAVTLSSVPSSCHLEQLWGDPQATFALCPFVVCKCHRPVC